MFAEAGCDMRSAAGVSEMCISFCFQAEVGILDFCLFFFKQKTAYEIGVRLVGSEMCIRDRFYDEERIFRITGKGGESEFVRFSGEVLRARPAKVVGGVELGSREPVFDIVVSAEKKSTFSRLSQNETAKECYQLGFFAPANADAALAALEMMDFEGIEKVRQRVRQNGTLARQLAQICLLYTSDAADEEDSGGLGGGRIFKKKNKEKHQGANTTIIKNR